MWLKRKTKTKHPGPIGLVIVLLRVWCGFDAAEGNLGMQMAIGGYDIPWEKREGKKNEKSVAQIM